MAEGCFCRSSKRLSVQVWDFMSGWNHHIAPQWREDFQTESSSSVLVLQGGNGNLAERQPARSSKTAVGQALWFSVEPFAKAIDWTTTGLMVLVRNS